VVEHLRERHAEQTVALVSHNFVLGCLLTRALGLPVHAFRRFRLSVASATTLNFRADRTMLVQLNDTCHLAHAGLPSTDPWPVPPRP
jgi:broad specificity phosphatase PhoE